MPDSYLDYPVFNPATAVFIVVAGVLVTPEAMRELHDKIVEGETMDLTDYRKQLGFGF